MVLKYFNIRLGDYPKEYNEKVHGPYDPARYYGKPDVPFGDLKLSELGPWLSRRSLQPRAIAGLFGRAYWRWTHKYFYPKYSGISFFIQLCVCSSIFFFLLNVDKIRAHKNRKYHW